MAPLARAIAPGYPHCVTQRGVRSLPIFRNDEDNKKVGEIYRLEDKTFLDKDFALGSHFRK